MAAAARWEALFSDPVTVRLDVGFSSFGPTGSSTLGSAGSDTFGIFFDTAKAALARRRHLHR